MVTITSSEAEGSIPADSDPIFVEPAPLDHFSLSPIVGVVAGTPIPDVTVTALDAYHNVVTDYDVALVPTTNMHGSLSGCTGASDPCIESAGTLGDWTDGQAAITGAVGYTAESARNLHIEDGAAEGNATFDAGPGPLASFAFTGPSIPDQTAGTPFPAAVQVTAYDLYGNIKTDETTGKLEGLALSTRLPNLHPGADGHHGHLRRQ